MAVVIIPSYKPDQTLQMIVDGLWAYGHQVIAADDGSGEEYQSIPVENLSHDGESWICGNAKHNTGMFLQKLGKLLSGQADCVF